MSAMPSLPVLDLAERATYLKTWSEAPLDIVTDSLRDDYIAECDRLRRECNTLAQAMFEGGFDGPTLRYFIRQAEELGEMRALEEIVSARLAMPMPPEDAAGWQRDLDEFLARKARLEKQTCDERASAGMVVSS